VVFSCSSSTELLALQAHARHKGKIQVRTFTPVNLAARTRGKQTHFLRANTGYTILRSLLLKSHFLQAKLQMQML